MAATFTQNMLVNIAVRNYNMGAKKIKAAENLQFSLFDRIRFGCDFSYTGYSVFEMATFKFRVRELWIYMQMKFKLYSRARIDLLELKSRIIDGFHSDVIKS